MKYCPECRNKLQIQVLDGIERKLCTSSDCGFVVWDNPVPVVAGVVIYQGKLLLARNSAWPESVFSMITGYLERFEAPEQAIQRELQEELGLNTRDMEFIGHYPFRDKNQLIIAYAIHAEGELRLNEEIAATQMISLENISKKDFAHLELTRRIIKDWLKRRS